MSLGRAGRRREAREGMVRATEGDQTVSDSMSGREGARFGRPLFAAAASSACMVGGRLSKEAPVYVKPPKASP